MLSGKVRELMCLGGASSPVLRGLENKTEPLQVQKVKWSDLHGLEKNIQVSESVEDADKISRELRQWDVDKGGGDAGT